MKLTRFSITSLVAVSITTFSIAAEPAKPSPISFSIDAQWLHSDDYADNTAALAWDFLWSTEQDNLPSFYYRARLHSSGVIAIDSELNRTPLIIEGDAFGEMMLGGQKAAADFQERLRQLQSGTIPSNRAFHSFYLQSGITGRYETDQQLDHRNGVASAFVEFSNNNLNTVWSLIPTFRVSLDGVVPDENATADAMAADTDPHLRLRALAHWNVALGILGSSEFLRRSFISATLQYSRDFNLDRQLRDAGQDESFGTAVEYAFLLDKGERDGANVAPWFLFVRGQTGRFAPEPENDTSLLVGFRYGMGDMKKLLSR